MKNLPIGVSTFESIIKEQSLYVDKTEIIYQLLQSNYSKRYFLSRPRRFGKSLTCSTIEAVFSGNKELFKDLWIESSNFEWIARPVIWFNFSRISHNNATQLIQDLHAVIDAAAEKYALNLSGSSLKIKLTELIIKLGKAKGPVVILVDEYDKPITNAINNPEVTNDIQITLREFYGALKDNEVDANLHFLFVTGVSKFSKISLFSDLNNLDDITDNQRFAALVGYTQQEVETYFVDHIKQFAQQENLSYSQMLLKLKTWYNGFRFTKSEVTVYNPFSVHKCLNSQDFSNYWFSSGTPRFLINIFAKEPGVVKKFVCQPFWEIAASEMETFSPEVYFQKIIPLMLQTGYLTITDYNPLADNYMLDYPNHEVRLSMTKQIMEFIAHVPHVMLGKLLERFVRALQADDIDAYCTTFRDYLKQIPHDIIVDREKFFQAMFVSTALLVDVNAVLAEVATDQGFIDVVVHSANKVWIMEFKKDKTPQTALQQIFDKKYHEKYALVDKPVILVGINFDIEEAGVNVAWISQALVTNP